MPYKAKRPCAYLGCPKLTAGRYCENHTKAEAKRYNRYDRDPESNKRYGRSWARIRTAFLAAHPLCERCREEGRLTPAVMVHHKRRLIDGGTNDWNNLQALCSECHSRLHAESGDYF